MLVEIIAVVFVSCLAVLGWFRGLLAQVVTIGSALALYFSFDLWFPPIDVQLASLGPALAEQPYLRKLVGSLGAYFGCIVLVALLELLLVNRLALLKRSNQGAGAALGLLKGLVYACILIWMVETAVLWKKAPDEPTPRWMATSVLFEVVGPWNPVRVYSLKQILEQQIARGTTAKEDAVREQKAKQREAEASEQEELIARLEAQEEGRRRAPKPVSREQEIRAGGDGGWSPAKGSERPISLEDDPRLWRVIRASPVQKIINETASQSEWQGRGYGELVMDPRVREVLKDADIADLLLGD